MSLIDFQCEDTVFPHILNGKTVTQMFGLATGIHDTVGTV